MSGAKISVVNHQGMGPLDIAVNQDKHLKIVEMLRSKANAEEEKRIKYVE